MKEWPIEGREVLKLAEKFGEEQTIKESQTQNEQLLQGIERGIAAEEGI